MRAGRRRGTLTSNIVRAGRRRGTLRQSVGARLSPRPVSPALTWSTPPYDLCGVNILAQYPLRPFRPSTHYESAWPDLNHAPYVLYGVKYIGLVSLAPFSDQSVPHYESTWPDLDHAPYALYGVKYIDLVSLAPVQAKWYNLSAVPVSPPLTWIMLPCGCMPLNILTQYPFC